MKRLILLCLALSIASEARAQASARPDSGAWRPIMSYVISHLAMDILSASAAPEPRSWKIVLPDSSEAWLQMAAHLRMALRARLPRADDTDFDELTIGPLRVSGDTVTVRITRDHGTHCPGGARSSGYGNVENVQVYRFQGRFWSAARSLGVMHGDRIPCM